MNTGVLSWLGASAKAAAASFEREAGLFKNGVQAGKRCGVFVSGSLAALTLASGSSAATLPPSGSRGALSQPYGSPAGYTNAPTVNLTQQSPGYVPEQPPLAQPQSDAPSQWYTGSLISPSGIIPKGAFDWEPYLQYSRPIGYFNGNGHSAHMPGTPQSLTNLTLYKYGLLERLSIQVTPSIVYKWNTHTTGSSVKIADLPVDLFYRFVTPHPERYIPAFDFSVGASFPTGDYERLGRDLDGVGMGNYVLRLSLIGQSTYVLPNDHNLRVRVWGQYRHSTGSVKIRDISSYGTVSGFDGRARQGDFGEAGFSLEYGLSQRWVLALDLARDWANGSRISGRNPDGTRIRRTGASSGDWVIGPGVEYNWSPRYGIIVGSTFYFAGHNTRNVATPMIAFNSYWD